MTGSARPAVSYATRDHTPDDEVEASRIRAGGGALSCVGGAWRVEVDTAEGAWRPHLPNMATTFLIWQPRARWKGSHVYSGMHMHHQRCVIREGVQVIRHYLLFLHRVRAGGRHVARRRRSRTRWHRMARRWHLRRRRRRDITVDTCPHAHRDHVRRGSVRAGLVGADVVSLLSLTHARARVTRRRCMGRARRCRCRRFGSVGGGEVGSCCSDGGRGAAGARRGRG